MNKKLFQFAFIVLSLTVSQYSVAVENTAVLEYSDIRGLTFNYKGLIVDSFVKNGDSIAKGTLLAKMDDEILKIEIKKASADLASTNASYQEVKQDHERALELFDRDILSQVEMDKSQNTLDKNAALRAFKNESLSIVKKKQTYFQIFSPYDAVVLLNEFYRGKLVNNDMTPHTIIKLAAKNKIQFVVKKNSPSSKKIIKVTVNNKSYQAHSEGFTYKATKFYNMYQIISPNAHLLVGKKVKFTVQ